jgi:hypothetical protein
MVCANSFPLVRGVRSNSLRAVDIYASLGAATDVGRLNDRSGQL